MNNILRFCFALIALSFIGSPLNAQIITGHTESNDTTSCGSFDFNVTSNGCVGGGAQSVKIHFGDGSVGAYTVSCAGTTGNVNTWHNYAASGTYTVKEVLYSGTTPLDSIVFSLTISYCRNLPVNLYLDGNSNCVFDAGDAPIYMPTLIEVDSAGVPVDTISVLSGFWYGAVSPAGTIWGFKVLTPASGLVTTCPSTGIVYITMPPSSGSVIPGYIGFECASVTPFDLAASATFRPAIAGGGANRASITVTNTNCLGAAAKVKFDYSPKYSFSAVYPSYSYTVSGTSVTIDIGIVSPYSPKNINVKLTPVTTLTVDDTVNSTFTVTPITGDVNTTDNIVIRCDTIRGSYDPNMKSVTPSGYISAGTRLEYMLQFENDGNDTAYNIYVMDTLSNHLDISTLQMGVSTHKVNLIKYVYAGKNILKFDFPDIRLPDSSHHDYCRGSVIFSIKAKSTLANGTTIPNRVGIYFDTNPVVMTNSVFSSIPLPPAGIKGMHLSVVELYPNPVSEELIIKAQTGVYKTLTIYNVMGQTISTQTLSRTEENVNVSKLVPGIYYVALKGEAGTKTLKFEKK